MKSPGCLPTSKRQGSASQVLTETRGSQAEKVAFLGRLRYDDKKIFASALTANVFGLS